MRICLFFLVRPAWAKTWWCKSTTGLAVGTVSEKQGGYREVVAEGSWTQTPELTNRN